MGSVSLCTQGWAFNNGLAHWQSMTFTVLALSQMGHVFAVRSERHSLFVFLAVEGEKFLVRRGVLYRDRSTARR